LRAGDRRQETGDRKDGRQETGDRKAVLGFGFLVLS